ncbi:MAG: CARDB domain-containing protein [Candidatus Diapherotrites archaeon]
MLFLAGCTKNQPLCGNGICEKGENSQNCQPDCLFETTGKAKQLSKIIASAIEQKGSVQEIPALQLEPGEKISLKETASLANIELSSLCYSPGALSNQQILRLSIEYTLESLSKKTEEIKFSALCMEDMNSLKKEMISLAQSDSAFDANKLEKCNCTSKPCCAIVLGSEKIKASDSNVSKELSKPCKDLASLIKSRLGTDCNDAGFSSKADLDGDLQVSQKDLSLFEAMNPEETWCLERLAIKDTLCINQNQGPKPSDVFIKSISVKEFSIGFSIPCYFDISAEVGFSGEKAPKEKIKALFKIAFDKNTEVSLASEVRVDGNSLASARVPCKFTEPGKYIASLELFPEPIIFDANPANNKLEKEIIITQNSIDSKFPDLEISDLTLTPKEIAPDQPFAINYSIMNSGKTTFQSKDFIELRLQVGEQTTTLQVPVLNIEPLHRTEIFQYVIGKNSQIGTIKTPGIFRVSLLIDPQGKIVEKSKANNQKATDLIVLGYNAPPNPKNCYENDAGLSKPEEEIQGGCITIGGTYLEDSCKNNTELSEAFCSLNSCSVKTINCIQAGYEGCKNGACYKESTPDCTDSDSGMGSASISIKGTCKDSFWPVSDSCVSGYLFETFCQNGYCLEKKVDCKENGFNACIDGACK